MNIGKKMIRNNIFSLVFSWSIFFIVSTAYGAGYPHSPSYGVNCDDCHNLHGTAMFGGSYLLPDWTQITIDDTQANSLCWSCHNDTTAHHVETHSSLQMRDDYDDDEDDESSWTIDCVVCHDPHSQYQLTKYAPDSYLFTSIASSMTTTTITFNPDLGWENDKFAGYIVVPNTLQKSYTYKIIGNSSTMLTVDAVFPMDLSVVNVGQPSAIFYGKLVRDKINIERITDPEEPKTGTWESRFYSPTGDNSYSDGDTTIDGVCEICHTMTDHFQNDGVSGDDWPHSNADYPARTNCMVCHPHEGGFAHGGSCWECHGHDEGGNDVDYGPVPTGGKGTYGSHSTHTEMDSDDQRGPQLSCFYCHAGTVDGDPDFADFSEFYAFRTGTDSNSDGVITLEETDVCNKCHSPNGTYDGVNDPDLGAKYGDGGELGYNWQHRVYDNLDNKTLQDGLEKWCATCHDEDPSIVNDVAAPNVIGDEDDDTYTYSTFAVGYGYYKTGHGLPKMETYPASGGVTPGAGIGCDGCHDSTTAHVDGTERTFDDLDYDGDPDSQVDPSVYRLGYRLNMVYGGEPMLLPTPQNIGNIAGNFRLCASCHTPDPFIDGTSFDTNFITHDPKNVYDTGTPDNRHELHMQSNMLWYAADWSGARTSRMNCPSCHNVHGSTRMTMVRDGKLIGLDPGLEMWYFREGYSTLIPLSPEDLPLSASTGTAWDQNSPKNLCSTCHGGGNAKEWRAPFQSIQQAPTLAWTGENGYLFDGASPDSGPGGGNFVFRVQYTDFNNEAPSSIEVLIDINDNDDDYLGINEKVVLTEIDGGDTNYMDGKIYTATVAIAQAGDNILKYRFDASDGTDGATGPPTGDSFITVLPSLPTPDPPPVLDWLDDGSCQVNGAGPATGFDSSTTFTFSVVYTDDVCPSAANIAIWIDEDNDGYGGGDKYNLTGDGVDTDCTDGRLYTYSTTLSTLGEIKYYFYGSDGTSVATGDPTEEQTLTVLDQLARGTGYYLVCSDGSYPVVGACDYTTIQGAINATGANITLMVEQGTYHEKIALGGSDDNVIIKSDCGKDLTIIDADDTGTVVSFNWDSYGSVIDGFGITDGTRGVYLHGARGTIKNSDIYSNIRGDENSDTLANDHGAGVFSDNDLSQFTLINSEVYSNAANSGSGGGLYFSQGSHSITDSIIHDNSATVNGGGLCFSNVTDRLTMTGSEMYGNSAGGNGGGIYFHEGIYTVGDSTIRNNTATGSSGVIHFQTSGVGTTVTGTTIKDNTSGSTGGAMHSESAKINFNKVVITGNESTGSSGGALYSNNTSVITFSNSIISANTAATNGGAINLWSGGAISYINTTLADNHADGQGGAIWIHIDAAGNSTIRNSIFWNNVADTSPFPGHNIYMGDTGGSYRSIGTVSDSDINTTDTTYFVYATWIDGTNIITPSIDPLFVGGGDYHLQYTSPVIDQANGVYAPVDDIDGDCRPNGDCSDPDPPLLFPDMGADEYVNGAGGANNVPALVWTGEEDYESDGVDPDTGFSNDSFVFRVKYIDADDEAPGLIQLWIDENDNGVFDQDEKHAMDQVGVGTDFDDPGEMYTIALNIDGGDGVINYFFHASDGADVATGLPTAIQALVLDNDDPDLDWSSIGGYESGVNPLSAPGGGTFTFKIDYSDDNNNAPDPIQVWVDLDNSGAYDPGEKFNMVSDGGGTDYINGEPYTLDVVIPYIGDGEVDYRFYASDGRDVATDDPTEDNILTTTQPADDDNTAPVLSWVTDENCLINGARPPVGAQGFEFEFKVIYTDTDADQCAANILLLIDENDNSIYESDEKYILTGGDGGDTDCTDGKLYETTLNLVVAGDGELNYSFYATDNYEAATGAPVDDNIVTVLNDLKVRPSGGAGWFSTIQSAVNNSIDPSTILVYPNADFTAATYTEDIEARTVNLTMRSACGPDLTIIDGTGSAVLLRGNNQIFDGFSVTGAGVGIYLNPAPDNVTIKNNKIYGNSAEGINVNPGTNIKIENNEIYNNSTGIRTNLSTTTVHIKNCDIHDNSTTGWGAGILFNGGIHTITDTVIRDNSTSSDGGGIAFNAVGAGTTVTNTTISDNQAGSRGGGMFVTGGSKVTFDKCTITGNQTPRTSGGGMYIHLGTTDVVVKNSIIADNLAAGSGGAVFFQAGTGTFINDTFADNKAIGGTGGVFWSCAALRIEVRNSIFWGNTAGGGGNIGSRVGCNPNGDLLDVSYSDITEADIIGTGSIFSNNINPAQDPLFAGNGNYHILSGSPVIDQASDTYAPDDDIDGQARPNNGGDDMGADEYFASVNSTTAGIGTANAADSSNTTITVSMPYLEDANSNNTYTVDYKLSSDHTTVWTNWVTEAANTASPYTTTITGLVANEKYDVRMTYNDADGVTGTAQRSVSGVDLTWYVDLTTASQSVAEDVGTVTVTATLSRISGSDVTVLFTVSGTATGGGTDHDLADGNITVTAGQLTGTINFTVTDDSSIESDETVIVTMGIPVNASAGTIDVHTITITDND